MYKNDLQVYQAVNIKNIFNSNTDILKVLGMSVLYNQYL